jgi:hypothetical protein
MRVFSSKSLTEVKRPAGVADARFAWQKMFGGATGRAIGHRGWVERCASRVLGASIMALVPNTKQGKVNFYQSKIAPWTTNATAIGTTSGAVTALGTLVTAADTALAAQATAEAAARSAVEAANLAVNAMATAGADIISAIRVKARTAGDSVYTLAQIPAPATPSPRPAPGEPTNFAVLLQNNGAVTLTWKCHNPAGSQGTTYQVWRRIAGTDDLAFIGVTGEKKFVDATIPAGTTQATYQIQAFRSTVAGPWALFNVNFTTEIGGATVTAVATPKMAA